MYVRVCVSVHCKGRSGAAELNRDTEQMERERQRVSKGHTARETSKTGAQNTEARREEQSRSAQRGGSCYPRIRRHSHRQEREGGERAGEGRARRHREGRREKDTERICLGVLFPLIYLKVTDTLVCFKLRVLFNI